MLLNLFYAWIALMPILSISPWQAIVSPPFYYGFIYYFILLVLSLWVLLDVFKGKLTKPFNRQDLLLLGYVLVCILTLFINWNIPGAENPANTSGFTRFHIYNVFLIIYLIANISSVFVLRCLINDRRQFLKTIKLITLASVVACLWGLLVVVLHLFNIIPLEVLDLGPYFPRLMGTATEPQVFGNFLLIPLWAAMASFIWDQKLKNWIILLIIAAAFIMTFSAGAWAGGLIAALAFFLINLKQLSGRIWLRLSAVLIAVILFVSFLTIVHPKYTDSLVISKFFFWNIKKEAREYQVTKAYPDDKLHRTWMAQAAVEMFREKPILGVGVGNYGYIYNKYRPNYAPRFEFLVKTHNAFLEILAETGSLGFFLLFSWLAIALFAAGKQILSLEDQGFKLAYSAVFCAFLGILVHGLALGIFMHDHTWVALGLILAGGKKLEG